MFGFGKSKKNGTSQGDINARVAAIRALGKEDPKKKKKGNDETKFNELLSYLKDDSPECRIAAAETLGQTSKEIAVTYICQYIQNEKDERVIKAMKDALASIRANIREHN